MQSFTNLIVEHPTESGLAIAGLIVLLGLFVYGFADLLKFTPKRVWAIGGVVFRESIRRKVLWLTPLVMVGIVALTGLQRPDDAADAIRQTIQFSLFASGLLVVVSGVMLSCTNLPRDIETKIIFTIVTKPTTRLEIVLGKIIGFARVTGAILILMGLFTWGYVHLRAAALQRDIAAMLPQLGDDDFARNRLQHQRSEGLLTTRQLAFPKTLEWAAREPTPGSPVRWMSTLQTAAVPFHTEPAQLVPAGFHDPAKGETPPNPGEAGLIIRTTLSAEQVGRVEVPQPALQGPVLPDAEAAKYPYGRPGVLISIIDTATDTEVLPASVINGGKPIVIGGTGSGSATQATLNDVAIEARVDPRAAIALANVRNWCVQITPANENYLIGIVPGVTSVIVPGRTAADARTLDPLPAPEGATPALLVRGGASRVGRQLEGPQEAYHFQPVAIAHFAGGEPRPGEDNTIALEMTMDIDRLDDDAGADVTQIMVQVTNPSTGRSTPPYYMAPEKNKVIYADLPADAFAGGVYDVKLRTVTRGHSVSLTPTSIAVVQSRHLFGANLAKAFCTQWMLSVLVVTVGTCCSTFLSWPIAIVLSLVVLMAHWAVQQVSDSLQPGIGALLATDMGANSALQARMISTTFDNLARTLNFVSQFLPDIDRFSTVELVQRGMLVPAAAVGSAASVLALFGLPLLTLAYVVFRNKEVAP